MSTKNSARVNEKSEKLNKTRQRKRARCAICGAPVSVNVSDGEVCESDVCAERFYSSLLRQQLK